MHAASNSHLPGCGAPRPGTARRGSYARAADALIYPHSPVVRLASGTGDQSCCLLSGGKRLPSIVQMCEENLQQERAMVGWLEQQIPETTSEFLRP